MMRKTDIFLIYFGAFIISFTYGLYLSVPLFVNSLSGNATSAGLILGVSGIGTIFAVLFSKALFKKLQAKLIAAIGGLCYFIGSLAFLFVQSIDTYFFIVMAVLGMGWGLYYNAAPYLLSFFASDRNRSSLFSYLSAFSVMGTGIAPVFIKFLWGNQINFKHLFLVAALSGVCSFLIFYAVRAKTTNKIILKSTCKKIPIFSILKSTALYPIIMVFLGASSFSIMLNFQTLFATSIGMNYALFYITYSLAVVISRLSLGKYFAKFNQEKLVAFLLGIMIFSLISFLYAKYNVIFYILSSALFGLSYGLVYPAIQALAVNLSEESYRSDVVSYFSLSYFIGVYASLPIGGILITHFNYASLISLIAFLVMVELILSLVLFRLTNNMVLIDDKI